MYNCMQHQDMQSHAQIQFFENFLSNCGGHLELGISKFYSLEIMIFFLNFLKLKSVSGSQVFSSKHFSVSHLKLFSAMTTPDFSSISVQFILL